MKRISRPMNKPPAMRVITTRKDRKFKLHFCAILAEVLCSDPDNSVLCKLQTDIWMAQTISKATKTGFVFKSGGLYFGI